MRQILASVATLAAASESDIFTSTVQGIIQTLADTRDSNNKALTEWEKYFHRSQCLCNSVNAAASVNLGTQIAKFEEDLKIAQQEQDSSIRKKDASEVRENMSIQADRDGRNDAAKTEERTESKIEQLAANREAALKCYRVLTNDQTSLVQGKQANSLLATLKLLRKQMANGGTSLDTFQQSKLLAFQDEVATHHSLAFLAKASDKSVRNEAFKVGEVAGICKELADDFQRQKEELLKTNSDMREATTASLRTLNNDISLNQRNIALHGRTAMNKSFEIAELKTAIVALKSQAEAHTLVKQTAAESCAEVAMSYHKEVNEILQQNENISQAIDFLQNGLGDLARGQGVKEARTAPAFVQIKANTKSLFSTVRKLYHRITGSEPVTNFLSTGAHESTAVITPETLKPVIALIEELQSAQGEQQAAEAKDYDECKKRIASLSQHTQDLDRDMQTAQSQITLEGEAYRKFDGMAKAARTEKDELSSDLAQMTQTHKEKMENLTKEMTFKEKAIVFLSSALQKLSASLKLVQTGKHQIDQFRRESETYADQNVDGRTEAMPEIKKELSMDVADAMSNLSNMSSNRPGAVAGGVTGPHGALNAVLMQLQEEVTTIRGDISQDQQKYTSEVSALNGSINAADSVATENDQNAARSDAARKQQEADMKDTEQELQTTDVTLKRLNLNCNTLMKTFALRKQHYDNENAAIITVKSQLESLIGTTLVDEKQ